MTVRRRSFGATGVAAMQDPVRLSLRDLAYLAIAVSDNAAADVVFDAVGDDAVAALLAALGLAAHAHPAALPRHGRRAVADPARRASTRCRGCCSRTRGRLPRSARATPRRTNASTARDMTALLAALWTDRAAAPASCAAVRRLMGLQVWPHRLASGFPDAALPGGRQDRHAARIRNEIGVVEHADGGRVAVAVFTRADTPAPRSRRPTAHRHGGADRGRRADQLKLTIATRSPPMAAARRSTSASAWAPKQRVTTVAAPS